MRPIDPSSELPTTSGSNTSNLPLKGVFLNSPVHPQKQSPHLEIEQYGSIDWATQPITLSESIFRHSSWALRRKLVFESLKRTGVGRRRLTSFADCGSCSTCEKTTDEVRIRGSSCKHALCEPCRQERAAKIRATLHVLCLERQIRFLTLTIKHNATPLIDQIDRLYRSFSTFRRRKSWLANVTGGAAFLEIKLDKERNLWHPHLHILIEGRFWDTREISAEWLAVTGDSFIVDITRPREINDVCAYAVGYCTKTIHPSVFLVPDKLDEAQVALRGRRMCLTFGSWRGTPLEPDESDDRVWITLGSIDTVLRRAAEGIQACVDWLVAAQRRYPSMQLLQLPDLPPTDTGPP